MADWKAKRFWKDVTAIDEANGFSILLDARPLRTPAKTPLIVPTRALADAIRAEWLAQENEIVPDSMPFTRMANSAIDKVGTQKPEVADMLADYGDADLLCYRAISPDSLVARQTLAWDPLLAWATSTLGVELQTREGVIHIPQKPSELVKLSKFVHAMSDFELAAFHDLVSMSGSLIIGLAAMRKTDTAENLWKTSRIDELWQQEQWGTDDEAEVVAIRKETAFSHAYRFVDFCAHRS